MNLSKALVLLLALILLSTVGGPRVSAQVAEYGFTDVTAVAGVGNAIVGDHFGATWSDYNGDSLFDIYVVNCSPSGAPNALGANTLYRNNGDSTFTDVTEETQAGDPFCAMRNVWADYDKDGDLDFYSHNFDQSTLYQNNSNVFTDVNASSGAGLTMPGGTGAAWADYDNDGYLDLHATACCRPLPADPGENALLHNNGDGTFTDLRESAGFPLAAAGMGNAWADYNNDGFQDLAIAAVTDQDTAFLYLNNGDGTFTDVTVDAGIVVEPGSSTFAVGWDDYDADGWFDLIVTEGELGSSKVLPNRVYLFRNKADGTFEDVTAAAGLTIPADLTTIREVSWADYDNDGDSDLYLGGNGPNMFYRNNSDGTFTNIAPELGLEQLGNNFGAIWADYDWDGDLDLYIVNFDTPNMLFENQGGTNNWLQLELIGTTSNFDAIGARINLTSGGKTQIREINGGTGFFSQHSPIEHFGLGLEGSADVEIQWPSGQVDILAGVSANQLVTVTETSEPPPNEPDISVSPTSVDFGSVEVGTSADQTVTITNNGLQLLTVSDLATTSAVFTVISPAVPVDVAASGGTQVVTVRFSPTVEGLQTGDLTITSNDPDTGVLAVPLTGSGSVTPAVAFRINVGGADYTDVNGDLFVADKAFVAGDFGYAGGSTASFTDPVAGTTDDVLYQSGRGGGSFSYNFDNLSAGDYDITLHLTEPWFDTVGQRLLDVTAEGVLIVDDLDLVAVTGGKFVAHTVTTTVAVTDGQLNLDFIGVVSFATAFAIEVVSATPATPVPDISVAPTSVDFGDVETGMSSDQIVTISNLGGADLEITGLVTTNAVFTVVSPVVPVTILPAGAQDVTVRFAPTLTGLHSGDLQIDSNDGDQPMLTVALTGNGTAPPANEPDISVSPASLGFGQVVVGTSSDQIVTITNDGLQTLTVSGLSATTAAFAVVSPATPFDVVSGGAQDLTVRFSPTVAGVQNGNLEITSNDPDEGAVNVTLTGEGVPETVVELRINVGGADYTDVNGNLFVADKAFVAGDFGGSGGTAISFTSTPVTGTTDDQLYQDQRGGDSFSYIFDGLPSGDYDVTLHFTEPWWTAVGQRQFDVTMEGVLVLDDFDVVAASGGGFVALTQAFTVNVTDGQLNVDFTGVLKAAIVSAVSVVEAPQ